MRRSDIGCYNFQSSWGRYLCENHVLGSPFALVPCSSMSCALVLTVIALSSHPLLFIRNKFSSPYFLSVLPHVLVAFCWIRPKHISALSHQVPQKASIRTSSTQVWALCTTWHSLKVCFLEFHTKYAVTLLTLVEVFVVFLIVEQIKKMCRKENLCVSNNQTTSL